MFLIDVETKPKFLKETRSKKHLKSGRNLVYQAALSYTIVLYGLNIKKKKKKKKKMGGARDNTRHAFLHLVRRLYDDISNTV